jgi:hypothetical protein
MEAAIHEFLVEADEELGDWQILVSCAPHLTGVGRRQDSRPAQEIGI